MAHCWGHNSPSHTDVPRGLRFQQISAGKDFTCGVRVEGGIVCWGDNAHGQADAPAGMFRQVAAGGGHACALDRDGAAVCWGRLAAAPASDFVFTAIGSGFRYSCGLTAAGDLKCWGDDLDLERAGPFHGLGVGLHHTCVLHPDGAAECYGVIEDYPDRPPATGFAEIAVGRLHTCGIALADSRLECWGEDAPAPAAAPAGTFTALSIGWRNSCALRSGGIAHCWRQTRDYRPAAPSANLVAVFGGRIFDMPVELLPWPAGGLAVAERNGMIVAHGRDTAPGSGGEPRLILDLTDRIDIRGERGLLGIALDPDFDRFPFLYVYYHLKAGADGLPEGRLSRFPVVDGVAIPADELVMLTFHNLRLLHQGGAVRFGPDGMLYLGLGDNNRSADAQDLDSRRGKILRIDVRGGTAAQPYAIPDDNPFASIIWAYGLRNPWRMDFDADGNLWVADVGGHLEEEVSLATAGANLGWPVFEGNWCRGSAAECDAVRPITTAPAVAYTRNAGAAIIGGVASPQPGIAYLFGDYASRRIWALEPDDASATGWRKREIAQADDRILAFGRGAAGEVFVLIWNRPIRRLEWQRRRRRGVY